MNTKKRDEIANALKTAWKNIIAETFGDEWRPLADHVLYLPKNIVIVIEGGVITKVYSDTPNVNVVLFDWDKEEKRGTKEAIKKFSATIEDMEEVY